MGPELEDFLLLDLGGRLVTLGSPVIKGLPGRRRLAAAP